MQVNKVCSALAEVTRTTRRRASRGTCLLRTCRGHPKLTAYAEVPNESASYSRRSPGRERFQPGERCVHSAPAEVTRSCPGRNCQRRGLLCTRRGHPVGRFPSLVLQAIAPHAWRSPGDFRAVLHGQSARSASAEVAPTRRVRPSASVDPLRVAEATLSLWLRMPRLPASHPQRSPGLDPL